MKIFKLPFLTFLSLCFVAGLAMAQTAVPSSSINVGELVSPILQTVIGGVSLLITALVGWLVTIIQKRTGIEIEAKHREALQTALTNAAGLALNKASGALSDKTINVGSPYVKEAIEYVFKAAPDAIDYFGLSPADLIEKLIAKLGLATAVPTTPTPAVIGVSTT